MKYCVLLLQCFTFVAANDFVGRINDTVPDVGEASSLSRSPTGTNKNESIKDIIYDHLKFLPICKPDDRSDKDYAKCFGITVLIIIVLPLIMAGLLITGIIVCYCKKVTIKSDGKQRQSPTSGNQEKQPLIPKEEKRVRLCLCCWHLLVSRIRKIYVTTEYELRREERLIQEASDKSTALSTSESIFPGYKFQTLADLGSRLQKYWYFRRNKKATGPDMLQMTMKVSTVCQLQLGKKEVSIVKELFKCLKNPLLLGVEDVAVHDGSIILLVEFMKEGSLRDQIYLANPCKDWATKYKQDGRTTVFSDEEMSTCGRHIIKAVLFLYEQGFPIIGQIHSGNVFKTGQRYVLGGYENTIFGYRTALYSKFCEENLLEHMDEIMLGLLLYEMATGLHHQALLKEIDFQEIHSSEIYEVLQLLCSDSLRRISTKEDRMHKVLKHQFFHHTYSYKRKNGFEHTPEGLILLQCVASPSSKLFSAEDCSLDIGDVLDQLKDKCTPDPYTCQNIGWRNGKAWAKVENRILSAIKVPYTCPIFVKSDMDSIRTILKDQWCTFLLKVHDVHYLKVHGDHVVVFVKQFVEMGSLKDWIHRQRNPWQSYEDKYSTMQLRLFSLKEIAKIGSQILNVICKLRIIHGDVDDPLPLLFIHSGNVFWDGKQCFVGGVENMLLGCRPRDYVKYKDHLHHIGEVMFGNLIFELATGQELAGALPTDLDYDCVKPRLKTVLKKIFEDSISLEEISFLEFFNAGQYGDVVLPKFKGADMLCLEKVKKGKYRDQDDELGKTKYRFFQRPIRQLREAFPKSRQSTTPSCTSKSSETFL